MAKIDTDIPVITGTTMGDITFAPTTLLLTAGESATFFADLTVKEMVVSANWYASPTGVTQLNITCNKMSEYGATFEVDTSRVVNPETGDILVTVEGQIEGTNGGYQRFERNGTIHYIVRSMIEPDLPPIDSGTTAIENAMTFTPSQLTISAGTSGVVNTSMSSNKIVTSAVWTAVDVKNSGIGISVKKVNNLATTTTIDASNLTGATSGTIRFDVSGEYIEHIESSVAIPFTDSFIYPYNILKKQVIVDSDPVISLTNTTVSVPFNTTKTVTASVSMNEQIISTDWSFTTTGTYMVCTLENNTSTSVGIKLNSANLIQDENGTIIITANVLYLSGDGTQKRKTVSKSLTYLGVGPTVEPEQPEPEVGIKGELYANPVKVIINKTPKIVAVNSTENVVDWTYTDNQLLTISLMDAGLKFANFKIEPKTYDRNDSTIAVFRAYYDKDKTIYSEVVVEVETQVDKILPVWQDNLIEFDESLGDRVEYTLVDVETNNVIYSGKVNKLPNSDKVSIDVSKIVGNYLSNPFPYITLNTTNVFVLNDYAKTVDVMVGGNIVETVTIYNSWGYEDIPKNNIISDPIRKVVDRRQFFICSVYNPSAIFKNVQYILRGSGSELYKYGISATHKRQTLLIDGTLSNYPQYDTLKVGNTVYKIIDSCAEWCLYYSNAYGGWDSLLVNGNVKKSDKISSQYYKKSYNNKTYEFEKTKYLNTITPSYVLYTDYFNDDEQSRFHHLIESTEVYLHNLNTNEFLPVNITNTTCDYTTYTNNGKKKWYNTINVDVAQEHLRK